MFRWRWINPDHFWLSPRPRDWCNSFGTSTPATPGLSAQLRHTAQRSALEGVGRPVSLVRVPPQTRRTVPKARSAAFELAPLLYGSTAGELIPELVRHGLQQLTELEVAAVLGAGRHERSEERLGYRNGYRPRALTTLDLVRATPFASCMRPWMSLQKSSVI